MAMESADAFVLASDVETFGVVVIEAQAAGLPVVCTASGGPDHLIEPANGLLVPAGDRQALSGALIEMRRRAPQYDRAVISAEARRRFGPESFARKFAEIAGVTGGASSRANAPSPGCGSWSKPHCRGALSGRQRNSVVPCRKRPAVTWSYRTSTTSSGRSGCHSPVRSVLQRLGPPGARPVKPGGSTSASRRLGQSRLVARRQGRGEADMVQQPSSS